MFLIMVRCSSDDAPVCMVDGTYSVTDEIESGNCPDSGPDVVTDTFRTYPDGLVALDIQGAPELTPVGVVNEMCTWTSSGVATVTDALSEDNNKATLQYSYTFNATGFSGILSVAIPPTKDLPNGCTGTARVTGVRR